MCYYLTSRQCCVVHLTIFAYPSKLRSNSKDKIQATLIELTFLSFWTAGVWVLWPSLGKSCHPLWSHSFCTSRTYKIWKKVSRANCFRLIGSFLCRNNFLLLSSDTCSIKFLCYLRWRCCWIIMVHWSILWICSGAYVQYRLIFPGNFFFLVLFFLSLIIYGVNSIFKLTPIHAIRPLAIYLIACLLLPKYVDNKYIESSKWLHFKHAHWGLFGVMNNVDIPTCFCY